MFDTIAAISSGIVNQPISIIRLSGSDALTIAQKIFNKNIKTPNHMMLGLIIEKKRNNQFEPIDEVLLTYFQSPHSFTGEDMVEIYAHGGVVNTQRILKMLFARGARQAERGEFSLRAVLNKKMDLIKAEAIHDLIFAQTEEQADFSIKKFDGQTSQMIHDLKNQLLNLIAVCETNIDYPEYDDIEILTNETLKPKIVKMLEEINKIIESSKSSQHIFEGINVAIIGKPNSGKSSLLNALLNQNKAIVSSTAGTTRDIVEGKLQIGQILLNFQDTAGIHSTNDEIEKQGIQKSLDAIKNANLIIHVRDNTDANHCKRVNTDDDFSSQINELIKNKQPNQIYIPVINKADLIENKQSKQIYISALHNDINNLVNFIKQTFPQINLDNQYMINNTRQLALINEAKIHLETALEALNHHSTPDTVIVDLQKAWAAIANVLGVANNETLLDEMFKSFCLGK